MADNCTRHPDRVSDGPCAQCGGTTCAICKLDVDGRIYCSLVCFTDVAMATKKRRQEEAATPDPLAEPLNEPSVVLSEKDAEPAREESSIQMREAEADQSETSILDMGLLKREEESSIQEIPQNRDHTSMLGMARAGATLPSWMDAPPTGETPIPMVIPGTRRATIESLCVFHPATAAVLRCSRCGDPICTMCVTDEERGGRCSPVCRRERSARRRKVLLSALGVALLLGLGAWGLSSRNASAEKRRDAEKTAEMRREFDAKAAKEAERLKAEAVARAEAQERLDARAAEAAKLKAEAEATTKAEALAKEEASKKAEATAKAEAAAKADAEAKLKAEMAAAAKAAAERAAAEALAKEEARKKAELAAKAEAEAKAKAEMAAKAAAEQAKRDAALKAATAESEARTAAAKAKAEEMARDAARKHAEAEAAAAAKAASEAAEKAKADAALKAEMAAKEAAEKEKAKAAEKAKPTASEQALARASLLIREARPLFEELADRAAQAKDWSQREALKDLAQQARQKLNDARVLYAEQLSSAPDRPLLISRIQRLGELLESLDALLRR